MHSIYKVFLGVIIGSCLTTTFTSAQNITIPKNMNLASSDDVELLRLQVSQALTAIQNLSATVGSPEKLLRNGSNIRLLTPDGKCLTVDKTGDVGQVTQCLYGNGTVWRVQRE